MSRLAYRMEDLEASLAAAQAELQLTRGEADEQRAAAAEACAELRVARHQIQVLVLAKGFCLTVHLVHLGIRSVRLLKISS